MEKQTTPFAKVTAATAFRTTAVALMLLASAELSALGLGTLDVQSNLDQPLRAAIELRTNPGDDIDSVNASIASRADFDNLGIDYPSYLSDIDLTVDQQGEVMVLRVDSGDVIIKEPFIHFLVRVDWSGGSFIREYTALIDPPVYAADTPNPLAEPQLVGTDLSYDEPVSDSDDISVAELDESVTEAVDEAAIVDAQLVEDSNSFVDDSNEYIDTSVTEPAEQNEEFYQPEAVVGSDNSSAAGVAPADASAPSQNQLPAGTNAQYGPVEAGESLSRIAEDLQRQFPDLSIYQIMQVMFEENQSAFINNNINGLIKGSILNIGDLNVIRAVDVEQSKQFFREQLAEWDPSALASSNSDTLGVGQDEYNFESDSYDFDSGSTYSNDETAAADNFQVGASGDTNTFVSDGSGDSNAGEVLALRNQITELQTSLASSSQENQELTERISILEGQLADMNRLMNLSVEDADMANLETTLAAQNNADEEFAEFDTTTTEDDSFASVEEQAASDNPAFIDPIEFEDSDQFDAQDEASAESSLTPIEEVDELEETTPVTGAAVDSQPASAPLGAQKGWFEKAKDMLFADGMWRILAGVGAVLVGGLVLLIMRRRRADEEFEISMMSIGSQSQTTEANATASASRSEASAMSASVSQSEAGGGDKETSFLTVYSDSDAVVQADEVDPIAEADVYIAYGRDEQAEEVLLDGVASNPNRLDIKHKLLGLYHKNKNTEGFERVAEELYSQRDLLNPEVWSDVCRMGKDLDSGNPLFELSPEDIQAAGSAGAPDSYSDEVLADPEPVAEDPLPIAEESDTVSTNSEQVVEDLSEISETIEMSQGDVDIRSEAVGDALDEQGFSINLINFDDGRSEISELDEVEIDALELDDDEQDSVKIEDDADTLVLDDASASIEIDVSDEDADDSIEFEPSAVSSVSLEEASISAEPSAKAVDQQAKGSDVDEVSDLEIDDDYDEARTQYELAKVFVDLGDEDGARKILLEIIDNTDNSPDVLTDANELLQSIA